MATTRVTWRRCSATRPSPSPSSSGSWDLRGTGAPRHSDFAVKQIAAISVDCGPCIQLAVDMARESGMPDDQIETVMMDERDAICTDTRLGHDFGWALAFEPEALDAMRSRVRDRLGVARVAERSQDPSFALLLALERLSPPEHAAFLLNDAFDAP